MSDDEITAAAKRLRILWSGGTMDDAYGVNLGLDGQRAYCSFDMEALARAYLAEHPADDAVSVTEEWLRAVGFEVTHGLTISVPSTDARLTWFRDSRNWWIGAIPLADQPTRGHVRRLAAALGIALQEPPA